MGICGNVFLLILLSLCKLCTYIMNEPVFVNEWTGVTFQDCTRHCLENYNYCQQVLYMGNATCQFLNSE